MFGEDPETPAFSPERRRENRLLTKSSHQDDQNGSSESNKLTSESDGGGTSSAEIDNTDADFNTTGVPMLPPVIEKQMSDDQISKPPKLILVEEVQESFTSYQFSGDEDEGRNGDFAAKNGDSKKKNPENDELQKKTNNPEGDTSPVSMPEVNQSHSL